MTIPTPSPIRRIPLFVRKFIVDAAEAAITAVLVLNLVVPHTVAEAQAQAVIIGAAILSAIVSAARRAAPDFIAWIKEQVPTDQ